MAAFDDVVAGDVVVLGSGVAGLTTALAMPSLEVILVTKTELGDGSTRWAQGGIAASLSSDDSPDRHAADTIAVGGGLNDADVVEALADKAARGISRLQARGARFDTGPDGTLELGREAGHSVRRIVHAAGDGTGAEVSRALVEEARLAPNIRILERVWAADLVVEGGRVAGVVAVGPWGERLFLPAGAVVLATGGLGRLYANTTNPPEVTGDGLAMARRAGAALTDLEFVQFHPTALAVGADPMPLLTEALRGEGALLVDDAGHRFMLDAHPDAELAPRDVVARTVWLQLEEGRKVFLDARGIEGLADRFPTVFASCRLHGIDPRHDALPIQPAAHYHMGGVSVDLRGRSSIPGLWAVGEVSRSGAHGANRLASNSLLEGIVFGEEVAADVLASDLERPTSVPDAPSSREPVPDAAVSELRRIMWERVGVVRDRTGLSGARAAFSALRAEMGPGSSEERNMAEAAWMVATAALARTESRGAHQRRDFPAPSREWDHSLVLA